MSDTESTQTYVLHISQPCRYNLSLDTSIQPTLPTSIQHIQNKPTNKRKTQYINNNNLHNPNNNLHKTRRNNKNPNLPTRPPPTPKTHPPPYPPPHPPNPTTNAHLPPPDPHPRSLPTYPLRQNTGRCAAQVDGQGHVHCPERWVCAFT